MPHKAITVDYFLRDNRTWAPSIGKDWGIKAATGALANRADLRTAFDRYCRALRGDRGHLHGFGEAIGGVRAQDGYLLCVTLETPDPFGRPSWAIYGLWCPGDRIAEVATCDLTASIRMLLSAPDPPSSIALWPSSDEFSPSDVDTEHLLRRFDRDSTRSEVLSLLLEAHRRGAPMPSILGITASSDLSALIEEFNVVYCHPQDDDTRRAFEHLRTQTTTRKPMTATLASGRRPASSRRASRGTLAAVIGIGAVSLCASRWVVLPYLQRAPAPDALLTSRKTTRIHALARRLKTVESLDPQDLRCTPGYATLMSGSFISERIADRQEVRDAYTSLIELRERIVHRPDSEFATIRKIYSTPRGRQPPAEACRAIRDAFGVEFNSPDSTVRQWCESLVGLGTLSQSPEVLDTKSHTADQAGRRPS